MNNLNLEINESIKSINKIFFENLKEDKCNKLLLGSGDEHNNTRYVPFPELINIYNKFICFENNNLSSRVINNIEYLKNLHKNNHHIGYLDLNNNETLTLLNSHGEGKFNLIEFQRDTFYFFNKSPLFIPTMINLLKINGVFKLPFLSSDIIHSSNPINKKPVNMEHLYLIIKDEIDVKFIRYRLYPSNYDCFNNDIFNFIPLRRLVMDKITNNSQQRNLLSRINNYIDNQINRKIAIYPGLLCKYDDFFITTNNKPYITGRYRNAISLSKRKNAEMSIVEEIDYIISSPNVYLLSNDKNICIKITNKLKTHYKERQFTEYFNNFISFHSLITFFIRKHNYNLTRTITHLPITKLYNLSIDKNNSINTFSPHFIFKRIHLSNNSNNNTNNNCNVLTGGKKKVTKKK